MFMLGGLAPLLYNKQHKAIANTYISINNYISNYQINNKGGYVIN